MMFKSSLTEKQVFIHWMQALGLSVEQDTEGKFTDPDTQARFKGWLGRADVQKCIERQLILEYGVNVNVQI